MLFSSEDESEKFPLSSAAMGIFRHSRLSLLDGEQELLARLLTAGTMVGMSN